MLSFDKIETHGRVGHIANVAPGESLDDFMEGAFDFLLEAIEVGLALTRAVGCLARFFEVLHTVI